MWNTASTHSLSYTPYFIIIMDSFSQVPDDGNLKSIVDILRDEDMASYIDVSNMELRFYLEKEQYTMEIIELVLFAFTYS